MHETPVRSLFHFGRYKTKMINVLWMTKTLLISPIPYFRQDDCLQDANVLQVSFFLWS